MAGLEGREDSSLQLHWILLNERKPAFAIKPNADSGTSQLQTARLGIRATGGKESKEGG